MAGRFKCIVEGHEAIETFKRRYEFLEGVDIRLIGPNDDGWVENGLGTPFPLIAIVEGGLRFPFTPSLLRSSTIMALLPFNCNRTHIGS